MDALSPARGAVRTVSKGRFPPYAAPLHGPRVPPPHNVSLQIPLRQMREQYCTSAHIGAKEAGSNHRGHGENPDATDPFQRRSQDTPSPG